MIVIQNTPTLRIVNLDALPRGTGAKYLECISGQNGELVAKQWRRSVPKSAEIIVALAGSPSTVREG